MILYHGSDRIIEKPMKDKGCIHNDYGQGFYLTKHIELAKEWAVSEDKDGFVNVYEINDKSLKVLNLYSDEYSILHWLTLLLENRTIRINNQVSEDGMAFLKRNYHIDISGYDMIIGYRADDSYFSFARAFISNSISVSQLEKAMHLGELGLQYFVKSEKAFSKLSFIESVVVDRAEYYPLKVQRDMNARAEYANLTKAMDKDDTYLIDLIRREK